MPEIQIDDRDERALTEYLTVVEKAPGLFRVFSESGDEYIVDGRDDACTCPDFEYRAERCKHMRRVAFERGAREIPSGFDREKIDANLLRALEGDG